jgi:hypothetical protein
VAVVNCKALLDQFFGRRTSRKIIRWEDRLALDYRQPAEFGRRLRLVPDFALHFRTLRDPPKIILAAAGTCASQP